MLCTSTNTIMYYLYNNFRFGMNGIVDLKDGPKISQKKIHNETESLIM